jgi:pyruvate formate lyase activating enzyme
VRTVAVTAGYVLAAPRSTLFAQLDAANIDLKAFSDDFYRHVVGGRLEPVLETIEYAHHETRTWIELTTLVIPGYNDSDKELADLTAWVAERLGPDVPLHFTAFHPDFKMLDVAPTPPTTLRRARRIALDQGLRYVYTGNVVDPHCQTTFCPSCDEPIIERSWHAVEEYRLTSDGACPSCGQSIPGVFAGAPGGWGSRRVAVSIPGNAP